MAKITIVHPGPNSLRRGITPAIARQLLEATVAALKDAPGEFTLCLATHGAKLTRLTKKPEKGWSQATICEAIFMQYAPQIQDMQIMTPEEAVEHWRITIEGPTTYIKQAENEARHETAQSTTGQQALFPM